MSSGLFDTTGDSAGKPGWQMGCAAAGTVDARTIRKIIAEMRRGFM
jgi:hypothetical protein